MKLVAIKSVRSRFYFIYFEVAFFSSEARLGLDLTAFDTQSGAFDSLEKGGDNLALREEMRFSNIYFYYCEAYRTKCKCKI